MISFEYKGNFFSGFQKQCAQNQPKSTTVQGTIESALSLYTNGKAEKIFGSSRTDAGVHALCNTAHLEIPVRRRRRRRTSNTSSSSSSRTKSHDDDDDDDDDDDGDGGDDDVDGRTPKNI